MKSYRFLPYLTLGLLTLSYGLDVSATSENYRTQERRLQVSNSRSERRVNKECPICLEDFTPGETDVVQAPCGHIFRRSCINKRIVGNNGQVLKCPICKKRIKPEELEPVTIQ